MTRNEPPRKPFISTRAMFIIGVILVLFGVVMVVFFPNIK
jgi:hypothetical protein